MKLKRFLALAVSLAMVLAMVPAFSLTASAEETVLFDVDTITGSGEQTINVAGWTATEAGAAVRWNQNWGAEATGVWGTTGTYALMFFFSNTRNSSDGNVTAAINNATATSGATKVVVDFNFATQQANNIYQTWTYFDADGNDYARLAFDRNNTVRLGNSDTPAHDGSGTSAVYGFRGSNIKIETVKNDTDYTVNYYVNDVLKVSETVANANGFGGVKSFHGKWNDQYSAAGMQDLVITYEVPATIKTVTATYKYGDEVIATETKSYDSSAESGVTFDAVNDYVINGHNYIYDLPAVTLSESADVAVTAQENWAADINYVEVGEAVYKIESGNLVPNGNFADGLTGWFNSAGNSASAGNFTANTDGTVHAGGHTGSTGVDSLFRGWAVETGKKYLFTFTSSTTNEYLKVSNLDSITTSDNGNIGTGVAGTNNFVFDATAGYLVINFRWLGNNTTLGNFGLYEVSVVDDPSTIKASTTVKFIDATGTELQSATTIAGFVGDVIDLTEVAPETITYNGNLYSKDDANATSHTVATTADVIDVTYTTDAVTAITEVPTATVIGTNLPILPTTLKAETGSGSEVEVTVTAWDTSDLKVGENTVYGTVEGTTLQATATVTVLAETFTLSDITTVNGQDAGKASQVLFPVAISDEFNMEFTANYASFGDLWITIKTAAAGFFSPEQIPLGVNASGAFRPVNGNGTGGRTAADFDHVTLEAGVNYRFFIITDASTDKYSVTVTNEATGEVVDAFENYGYRTNADAIEAITSLTNNGNGSVTLTNIKVNANVSKNDYTVSVTMDGETTETTMSAWSAEALAATFTDIEGYEKTVSYDEEAKTVTVVYSATQTLKATFVDANENVIKEVNEVVALGETVTVNAEEIFFLDGDYNGYFYQIPETVLSADNNNLVITVSETANKYAAMEDMLVSDNEVWGMRSTDGNSVFVAAGADANRGPLTDANGENNHDANHTPSTLGKSRVGFFQFPVVDVTEGQKVTANFYVREWHGNGFSNSNATLRLAAYAVNDSSWVELSNGNNYDSANAPIFEGYTTPVFSQVCYNNVGYITFDITEMMMAANEAGLETITLRLNAPYGAAYIAEREACVVGGAYAGNAAYIAVEDAGLVKVTETGAATLTKNGSVMNGVAYVAATDDVRLVGDGAVAINTDAGYYYANKTMNFTEAATFENTVPAGLGLAMVSGAQVRIGSTELEEGAKLDALADSGIRFLATANYTDTVLADAEEFGIKVGAEASELVTYVPAVNFQDADETAFTAAITSLAESNYNRNFTATAYAKLTMYDGTVAEFTTGSVTRSIYQVSAGIMKNGTADADNAAYTVDGVVKNILNAYVNQTGIRLTYTADGITVENGKYTGDVFFTVESTVNEDGSVTVAIAPDTTWGTPAEIATWWTDYVRVNNNNSVAKTYISNAAINDGVLTFTFTVPAAE